MEAPQMHFGIDPAWLTALRAWAADEPRVVRVWIFGSRATGQRRSKPDAPPEPDLDVAYELVQVHPDETPYTAAFFRDKHWKAALQAQLPVVLDLQYAMTDDPEAKVPAWVADHGMLIYEDLSKGRPAA
jgi:hypothetical protein